MLSGADKVSIVRHLCAVMIVVAICSMITAGCHETELTQRTTQPVPTSGAQ